MRHRFAIAAVLALTVAACGSTAVSAPSTGPSATPVSTPNPTVAPSVVASQAATLEPIDRFLPAPDTVDAGGTCVEGGLLCTTMDVATWATSFTPDVVCSSAGTTCRLLAKIYAPTHPGPWPLFVVVGGCCGPDEVETYIDDLGKQLAGRGAVVMRADIRHDATQGGGYPASLADVACAIGVARNVGAKYGADATRVTLVGHSQGGWVTSLVALAPTEFLPVAGSCNETTGPLRPDAWAGLAPALQPTTPIGDVLALVDAAPAARHLPVALIQGGRDINIAPSGTRTLQAALVNAGFDSTLLELPEADHPGILAVLETIDELLALSERVP